MANLIWNFAIIYCTIYSVTGSLVHLGDIDEKSFYEESSVYLNWTDAHSYCLENGMRLAKVESRNQADFLAGVVRAPYSYWVSGKEIGNPVKHLWTSQGVHFTYSITWTDSRDADCDENCANFDLYQGQIEFVHDNCSSTYAFFTLCEDETSGQKALELPKRPERVEKVLKNEHKRPSQILNFTHLGDIEDKAFYLQQNPYVIWQDAYHYCEEANMSLARIESEVQANFLAEKLEEQTIYWIGMNKMEMSERLWTFDLTGAVLRMDFYWATDRTTTMGCGSFIKESSEKEPILGFHGCFTGWRNFLCQVNL